MRHSRERILTTHVGSLPRPQAVVDQLFAQDRGADYDEAAFDAAMTRAVRAGAQHPVAAGASQRSGRWQDFSKTECGLHIAQFPESAGVAKS